MKERVKDQIILLVKNNSLIKVVPNFANRIDKKNLNDELNRFIEKATLYIKGNYTTFTSMNNFIFYGLSSSELTLIDN